MERATETMDLKTETRQPAKRVRPTADYFCPFFVKEGCLHGKYTLNCEGGRFSFADKETRRDLVYGYCANPQNWEKCTIAACLCRQYDRE